MEIKVRKADKALIKELGMDAWPVWESPVTEFDWHYDDNETCLFLEGAVTVIGPALFPKGPKCGTGGAPETSIKAGDIVVFPKGLACRWKVLEAVKKRYFFGPVPEKLK